MAESLLTPAHLLRLQTMRDMLAPTSLVSSSWYPCLANMVFHSLRVRQPPPGHMARISIEKSPAHAPSS